jgi:hypothetical protein
MTESTPPSIPPRQRPTTTPATTGRSTTSSRANPTSASAWTIAPTEPAAPSASGRSTTSPTGAPSGAASATRSSTASDEATRTVTKPPASSNGSGSSSGSSAKPPTDRPRPPVRSSATGATKTDEPKPREETASREGVEQVGADGSDQPSPLMVAVDSTTSWLKKVAGATTAAITTATRPRSEETPMTSIPVANPPAPAGAPRPVAGANPAGSAARPSTGRIPTVQASTGPRRVRLAISRLDPWSVMKLSFLLSVAIGIMIVVGVAVGWFTLNELHVFTKVDDLITQVTGDQAGGVDILQYVEFQKVISAATLIAVIDVFLLTALATIGAFLYNIVAALVGGVHVTMTDE